jgi:hypothetical protein
LWHADSTSACAREPSVPWTGASTEVFYAESGRVLARCFVRLADQDSGIFERLDRYRCALAPGKANDFHAGTPAVTRAGRPLSENPGSLAKDGFGFGGRESGGRALPSLFYSQLACRAQHENGRQYPLCPIAVSVVGEVLTASLHTGRHACRWGCRLSSHLAGRIAEYTVRILTSPPLIQPTQ